MNYRLVVWGQIVLFHRRVDEHHRSAASTLNACALVMNGTEQENLYCSPRSLIFSFFSV